MTIQQLQYHVVHGDPLQILAQMDFQDPMQMLTNVCDKKRKISR